MLLMEGSTAELKAPDQLPNLWAPAAPRASAGHIMAGRFFINLPKIVV
jgi:hypothetical protein